MVICLNLSRSKPLATQLKDSASPADEHDPCTSAYPANASTKQRSGKGMIKTKIKNVPAYLSSNKKLHEHLLVQPIAYILCSRGWVRVIKKVLNAYENLPHRDGSLPRLKEPFKS
jgi:hypothetical protein